MQIAAVTTNAWLTVTLLTDRYTVSNRERVDACACARTSRHRIHVRVLDRHGRSRENRVELAEFCNEQCECKEWLNKKFGVCKIPIAMGN